MLTEVREVATLSMSVTLHPIHVAILTPKVMAVGDGALGSWLGHGSRTLLNGISTFIKEAPKSALAPSPM